MEEIDNIITHTLRQIGCNLDEETTSLSLFTPELIIEAASRCLNIIQPSLDLPTILPANIALRFKVTAAIATACKDIGYNGDIGYQAFLYSNENDLRRVFMFLIEHLPKDSDKDIVTGPKGLADEIYQAIATVVQKQLSAPFLYPECKPDGIRIIDNEIVSVEGRPKHREVYETLPMTIPQTYLTNISQASRNYWVKYLPTLKEQVRDNCVVQSVTSHDAIKKKEQRSTNITSTENEQTYQSYLIRQWQKLNDSTCNISNKVSHSFVGDLSENSDLAIQALMRNEVISNSETAISNNTELVSELVKETEGLNVCIENHSTEINNSKKLLQKILHEQSIEEDLYKKADEKYELIAKSRTLLDNSEDNLLKLQNKADACANKLISLAKQWEEHKESYMQQYQAAKLKANSKSSESQQINDQLTTITDQCKDLVEQITFKTSQHAQLAKEYENANKDINRSAYTRRIMEIIGNIGKQKADLDKVLSDTRNLQKEINNLSGQLSRSFTEVDGLIFEDARRHECGRAAYKLLAALQEDCRALVATVEATGAAVREARELEEQAQQEADKRTVDSLARVRRDLDSMRADSDQLVRLIADKERTRQRAQQQEEVVEEEERA